MRLLPHLLDKKKDANSVDKRMDPITGDTIREHSRHTLLNIEAITNDILFLIASLLSAKDLARMKLACRSFMLLFGLPRVWKPFCHDFLHVAFRRHQPLNNYALLYRDYYKASRGVVLCALSLGAAEEDSSQGRELRVKSTEKVVFRLSIKNMSSSVITFPKIMRPFKVRKSSVFPHNYSWTLMARSLHSNPRMKRTYSLELSRWKMHIQGPGAEREEATAAALLNLAPSQAVKEHEPFLLTKESKGIPCAVKYFLQNSFEVSHPENTAQKLVEAIREATFKIQFIYNCKPVPSQQQEGDTPILWAFSSSPVYLTIKNH